jgi:hypothetical protein
MSKGRIAPVRPSIAKILKRQIGGFVREYEREVNRPVEPAKKPTAPPAARPGAQPVVQEGSESCEETPPPPPLSDSAE